MGYTTINVESGKWYMLAPQFEDVANPGQASIDLLKTLTVKGLVPQTYGNRGLASEIQVYNPLTKGYAHWYYCKSGSGASEVVTFRNGPAVPSKFEVTQGCGVWLHVLDVEDSGATLTFNGQVKSEGTFTKNVGGSYGTWDIIANPYPVPLTVGMITTTGLTAQTYGNRGLASEIQVYNPDTKGYAHWYYCKSGSGASEVIQWRNGPGVPSATAEIVGVGGSIWIKALDEGSITFTFNN